MNFSAELPPWLAGAWQAFTATRARDRLPHAWLLSGPEGLGKGEFADRVAAALLCQAPSEDGRACGHCRSCHLFGNGTHPDFHGVGLLLKGDLLDGKPVRSDATAIRIDQIRALSESLALRPQFGRYRIAVIDPADKMNAGSANGLLKTLEEPNDETLLMLVTSQAWRLPSTVRSRCQELRFSPPSPEDAAAWLQGQGVADDARTLLALADGSPLRARELDGSGVGQQRLEAFGALEQMQAGRRDPVAIAADWSRDHPARRLEWLHGWLVDMIRIASSGQPPRLDHADLAEGLARLAHGMPLPVLYNLHDQVQRARRLTATTVSDQLLLEDVLLGWVAETRG